MSRSSRSRVSARWGWLGLIGLVALALSACGGGGGGGGGDDPEVRLDRTSVSIDHEQGGPNQPARVTATLDLNGYDRAVHVASTSSGPGLSQVLLSFSDDGRTAWADLYADTSLAPGRYRGTLYVHACKDAECRTQFSGSPYAVDYVVNVLPGLTVTPTAGSLSVVSGQEGTLRYAVQLPAGASSFSVESLPAWARLDSQDASGFTLRTRSLPVGVYNGYPIVRAGDRLANIGLELTSTTPPGGEHNLAITPATVELSTVEGASASVDVTVSAPTWKPTLTHEISYTSGGQVGWLTATPTEPGYRLAAAASALPAGSYSALLTARGDEYTQPMSVSVALTVGPGLVRIADRTLRVDAETPASALNGSATVALAGGPARSWTARSDQSWLVLDTSSGSTGGDLRYHVDRTALAAQANGSSRSARVTVSAGEAISPMSFEVTVTKALPELRFAAPAVRRAGSAQTLLVSGSGLASVTDLGARLRVVGVEGATFTRHTDRELGLSLPALAAGSYTVQVTNALDLPSRSARFQVIEPAPAPATRIAQTGTKRSLLLDAPRRALLLLNGDLGQIQRWSWSSGSWVSTGSVAIAGLNGIALSPDGDTLVASSSAGEVQLLDPATLALRSRHASGTEALYMGASDWTLPVTNDGRVWLARGSGWNTLTTFDLLAQAYAQPDLGSLSTSFYYGPWGIVSGNGGRLLLSQSASISPSPPMLFIDQRQDRLLTAPLTETFFFRSAFNDDASRLVLTDHAKVLDGDFGTVGQIALPGGQSVAAAQFAPDGRRLYVVGVSDSFYSGDSLPTLWVLDSSAAAPGTTTLPVLGSFEIAQSYTYACNWAGGGDTGCLAAPLMRVAPDGRTIFLAGPTALLSVPVPQDIQALSAPRMRASGASRAGLPMTIQRWGDNRAGVTGR